MHSRSCLRYRSLNESVGMPGSLRMLLGKAVKDVHDFGGQDHRLEYVHGCGYNGY